MAALLPLMNLCVERDSKQSLGLGYRILYISPLRALINQQSRDNGDIASLAKAVGYDCTPWMSDIDSNRKSRSWEHPNGILLTTPESIEGRLLRDPDRVRRNFSRLQFIVIDELHAYFEGERGRHLRSVLARLEARAGGQRPRIALSATLGNTSDAETAERDVARLGRFLRPGSTTPPLVITESGRQSATGTQIGAEKYFDLRLNVVMEDFERPALAENMPALSALTTGQREIVRQINELYKGFGRIIRGKPKKPLTALVFANSRHDVEEYTAALNAIGRPIEFSSEWDQTHKPNRGNSGVKEAALRQNSVNSTGADEEPKDDLTKRDERVRDPSRYWPHHGSLNAANRKHAEERMSGGMVGCVLVSTTTLELGIDVGTIENVTQIGAGPSVASLRQRLGRSRRYAQQVYGSNAARTDDPPPRLDLFVRERCGDVKDLGLLDRLRVQTFQALAQITLLRRCAYESPRMDSLGLSTLSQQILCMIHEYRTEGVTQRTLRKILAVEGPFKQAMETRLYRTSRDSIFDSVLNHLQRSNPGPAFIISDPPPDEDPEEANLYLTPRGVRRVERPDIYSVFPSPVEFLVVSSLGRIGSIDARANLSVGDVITLQGRGWEVTGVNRFKRQISVRSAGTVKAPHFPGDPVPVSGAVV